MPDIAEIKAITGLDANQAERDAKRDVRGNHG